MQFTRAVNTQTHKEVMLFEKHAPFIIKQGAIGLQVIMDNLACHVLSFKSNYLSEKINPAKGWFASLPGEDYFVAGLLLDVLFDELLKNLIRHAPIVCA
jgi:hypothetical protein